MTRPTLSLAAAGLAVLHLALALLAGTLVRVGHFDAAADFYAMYWPGARELLAGQPYSFTRSGPAYAAFLALVERCGGDVLLAAKLLAAVATTLVGWLGFVLARPIVGARPALLGQVLTHLLLFRWACLPGNDLPCAALSLAALALLVTRDRPGGLRLAAAGLLAGLACATRYPAASVLGAATVALALWIPAGLGARARIANVARFLAGAALALAPWVAANLAWYGEPFHTETHALIALEVFGAETEQVDTARLAEMERRFSSLGEVIAHDPARFAGHYARDFYEDAVQMLTDSTPLPASLFLGAGLLWLLARGERRGAAACLALYMSLAFALSSLAPYQARYHYPILPLLQALVAAGLLGRFADVEDARLRRARAAACAVVLAVVGAGSLWKAREFLRQDPREVLPAAEVLHGAGAAGDAVVCRKAHVATLAGLAMQPPARGLGLARFLDWCERDSGARFLYVGPREVRDSPPLAPLARGEADPARLELLHRHSAPDACLYRIVRAQSR